MSAYVATSSSAKRKSVQVDHSQISKSVAQADEDLLRLAELSNTEIPASRKGLLDSSKQLADVADYCQKRYEDALEVSEYEQVRAVREAKQYTVQALASVAYTISVLATQATELFSLQFAQLEGLDAAINHVGTSFEIYNEKKVRLKIGKMSKLKRNRPASLITRNDDADDAMPVYVRKDTPQSILDNMGYGFVKQKAELTAGGPDMAISLEVARSPGGSGSGIRRSQSALSTNRRSGWAMSGELDGGLIRRNQAMPAPVAMPMRPDSTGSTGSGRVMTSVSTPKLTSSLYRPGAGKASVPVAVKEDAGEQGGMATRQEQSPQSPAGLSLAGEAPRTSPLSPPLTRAPTPADAPLEGEELKISPLYAQAMPTRQGRTTTTSIALGLPDEQPPPPMPEPPPMFAGEFLPPPPSPPPPPDDDDRDPTYEVFDTGAPGNDRRDALLKRQNWRQPVSKQPEEVVYGIPNLVGDLPVMPLPEDLFPPPPPLSQETESMLAGLPPPPPHQDAPDSSTYSVYQSFDGAVKESKLARRQTSMYSKPVPRRASTVDEDGEREMEPSKKTKLKRRRTLLF